MFAVLFTVAAFSTVVPVCRCAYMRRRRKCLRPASMFNAEEKEEVDDDEKVEALSVVRAK